MGGEKTSARTLSGAFFVSTGLPGTSLSDYFFISLWFYLYHVHRPFFSLGSDFTFVVWEPRFCQIFGGLLILLLLLWFLPETLWTMASNVQKLKMVRFEHRQQDYEPCD